MSWSERYIRFHKQQTDCAIRRACARLTADSSALPKFHELLHYARNRASRLFEAPVVDGHHPGVEALVNLSRFESAHIRPAVQWPGTTSSWRLAVSSLAHHLVCTYEVPMFLTSSWYLAADAEADKKRAWFVEHARGAPFRSLELPIAMTRKMEHIFLASHDHLEIERAIRRAELLALGAPTQILDAVLSTRIATDLSNGKFWRTVWIFLVANKDIMDPAQIGPMIDFIQAIRHERVTAGTPDGTVEVDPPQPEFSMKGRTVPSILRLMRDWHRRLAISGAGFAWTPSRLRPMVVEDASLDESVPPKRWQMVELTNSLQLRTEGAALHHCVASYAGLCQRGISRIWSLRCRQGEKIQHVLTIEIDPKRHAIVQARGRANSPPSGKPLRLLEDWAHRERLRLSI